MTNNVAIAILHSIAINKHDDVLPPPLGINPEDLDYLIHQGQIPAANLQNLNYEFRNEYSFCIFIGLSVK